MAGHPRPFPRSRSIVNPTQLPAIGSSPCAVLRRSPSAARSRKSMPSTGKSIASSPRSIGSSPCSIASSPRSMGSRGKSIASSPRFIGSRQKSIDSSPRSIPRKPTTHLFSANFTHLPPFSHPPHPSAAFCLLRHGEAKTSASAVNLLFNLTVSSHDFLTHCLPSPNISPVLAT